MSYWKVCRIANKTAKRMKEHSDRCRNCIDDKECRTYIRIFQRGCAETERISAPLKRKKSLA